jgi:hypothetical protein
VNGTVGTDIYIIDRNFFLYDKRKIHDG